MYLSKKLLGNTGNYTVLQNGVQFKWLFSVIHSWHRKCYSFFIQLKRTVLIYSRHIRFVPVLHIRLCLKHIVYDFLCVHQHNVFVKYSILIYKHTILKTKNYKKTSTWYMKFIIKNCEFVIITIVYFISTVFQHSFIVCITNNRYCVCYLLVTFSVIKLQYNNWNICDYM